MPIDYKNYKVMGLKIWITISKTLRITQNFTDALWNVEADIKERAGNFVENKMISDLPVHL